MRTGSFIITHGDTQPLAFTVHTWRRGTDCDRPLLVRGFTAHYILCDNEQDMITKWAASMRTHSVDLYTGWLAPPVTSERVDADTTQEH